MGHYRIRSADLGTVLADNLPNLAAVDEAADQLCEDLTAQLQRNGEGAGRIRLRLAVDAIADGQAAEVAQHVYLCGTSDSVSLPPLTTS